ncbi:MAG: hypothetical protein WEG36_01765 [Gemmatimonadota bacterium]
MRRSMMGLLGVFALAGAAHPASAQVGVSGADARWLPWIGCWDGAAMTAESATESYLVCVRPLDTAAGVQIETYAEGTLVTREEMRADGNPVAIEEDGCVGTQSARWSSDGARVLLESEMSCGSVVARSTTGTLAILPDGFGWVEIQAVRAGDAEPLVGIRTFAPAAEAQLAELGVADPTAGGGLAVVTARGRAGAALSPDAIAELVERTGPSVAGALVIERGEPFDLDAELLRELAVRGVPGEVLDVMVAVTYPERFTVLGGSEGNELALRAAPEGAATRQQVVRGVAPWPSRPRGYGYSPFSFGYGYYDSYWDPFSPYGYGRGYGFGYYDYPRVIVVGPPVVEERSSVLSRNRGVIEIAPSGGGASQSVSPSPQRRANQRPSNSGSTTRSEPRSSGSAAPSSGSSGSGGSRGTPSTGGSSSDGERRAVPRTGG